MNANKREFECGLTKHLTQTENIGTFHLQYLMDWDLMQRWRMDRMVGIWIVLLSMLPGGCHKSFSPVTTRADGLPPADQTIASEPLILHCDFVLPQRQRLVDQLVRQRSVLHEKLNLASSDEPVHVTLFASDQAYYEFLGRQFPDFPPRRALFVETDSQLAVYAYWGDHVVEDLRHEVTHGYLHSVVPRIPLWLDEGLAEYFEVGREHQGFHCSHVALLHQQLRTGAWQPDLVQLESLESAGKMTQQDYAESWAWVHFLLETRGKRRELLAQYLADLQESQTAGPLSRRLDIQLARADLALIEHLESLQQATSEQ